MEIEYNLSLAIPGRFGYIKSGRREIISQADNVLSQPPVLRPLQCTDTDPSPPPLQICDTLSELAGKVQDSEAAWPELLPFIFQCVQSGDVRLMESALFIFGDLARSMMPTLMQYMGTLHQVRITLCPARYPNFLPETSPTETFLRNAALESQMQFKW